MLLRLGVTKHAFFPFNTTLVLNMVLLVIGLFSPQSNCGWVGVFLVLCLALPCCGEHPACLQRLGFYEVCFFFSFFFFLLFWEQRVEDRGGFCNNPGYSGTFSVDQADLGLTEICLILPLKYWD